MVSISPPDKGTGQGRTVNANDRFSPIDGRKITVAASPERKNAITRTGKSIWTVVKRVNKVVGEAEARLILRVFYYSVFGVVSLALKSKGRKSTESVEQAEVAWSPRVSPGTDPTKQY